MLVHIGIVSIRRFQFVPTAQDSVKYGYLFNIYTYQILCKLYLLFNMPDYCLLLNDKLCIFTYTVNVLYWLCIG